MTIGGAYCPCLGMYYLGVKMFRTCMTHDRTRRVCCTYWQCSRGSLRSTTADKLYINISHTAHWICASKHSRGIGCQVIGCTEPADQLCCKCLSGSPGIAHLCIWALQTLVAVAALSAAENLSKAALLPAGPLASDPVRAGLLASDTFCLVPGETDSMSPTLTLL